MQVTLYKEALKTCIKTIFMRIMEEEHVKTFMKKGNELLKEEKGEGEISLGSQAKLF